ncbi:MAG: HAD-IIIC family phosphatase [Methylacidiphilales bacterium]|nr:HAD-IIIC family phosphatase [Candidatus Methylacidiphilales bacterium]
MPKASEWQQELKKISPDGTLAVWSELRRSANFQLSFAEVLQLDRALQKRFRASAPGDLSTKPVRLAVLGSSTVEHLLPGIRIGALRRNLWVTTYTPAYGQFLPELLDVNSELHRFKPTAVVLAMDAHHLLGAQSPIAGAASIDQILGEIEAKLKLLWSTAQKQFGCQVIQQTVLPLEQSLLGQNEQRLGFSKHHLISTVNQRLRSWADSEGVDLLALDHQIMLDGLSAWHDPALWHKAKQEVRPQAAPLYGDLVARLMAAAQGLSAKCLVLDLDNTLWGGVIGDDGLEGIKLGQGSSLGESFVAMQRYALGLSRRGIILAACSKNDEANAWLPFDRHPEMILKRNDIACLVANWDDKPGNLREIARRLNIGLDALVFVDDNPFERNIVRRELPMVSVPELPDDPALFPASLAAAGYFESIRLTSDDLERGQQYQANLQREELRASATDLEGYLRSLAMELQWSPFDRIGLQRIVQLINKTNQFNLTTRRYNEPEVLAIMSDPRAFTLQLRVVDRFGDNGIIGLVIVRAGENGAAVIDTWLMSCRVLGRGVEDATLSLICDEARRLNLAELVGEYLPTEKNGMVSEHFAKLGFTKIAEGPGKASRWRLALKHFVPRPTCLTIKRN